MRVGVLCVGGGDVWGWGYCVGVGVLCGGGDAVWGWGCCVRAAGICEGVHVCGL